MPIASVAVPLLNIPVGESLDANNVPGKGNVVVDPPRRIVIGVSVIGCTLSE
jgi:hypothetical protein